MVSSSSVSGGSGCEGRTNHSDRGQDAHSSEEKEERDGQNPPRSLSDGVIAIIITIMVLELKVPHSADFRALLPLWPIFMSYVLSFIYVGIYWNKLQYACHPSISTRTAIGV
jgi:uncharacterized membrane protein